MWTWLPGLHLVLSLAIAGALAGLIFGFWFAPPHYRMAGGMSLFWWIVGVDAVCGPLLTWLLIKPHKTRKALFVDVTLIACVQLAALVYGIHTLAHARPLALVFEVDRFRVLSYSDIPETELHAAPVWFQPWGLQPPHVVGLRSRGGGLQESMASLDAALQGVDAGQFPQRWQDYDLSRAQVLGRARPLAELRAHYPLDSDLIDTAIRQAGLASEGVLWLPLTTRQSSNWIALIRPADAQPVGYLPLDGFF